MILKEREAKSLAELLKEPTFLDIMATILIESGETFIPTDREFLHTTFQSMKNEKRYSHLFNEIVFSDVEIFPFSRELEDVISKLQIGGFLIVDNPTYGRFRVNDDKEYQEMVESIIKEKNFIEDDRDLLRKLGQEFKKSIDVFLEKRESG